MKNYEKYADEIRELESDIGIEWCEFFAKPKVLKSLGKTCEDVSCGLCSALAMLWLLEEHKEPETDWSKVPVDTPILVKYFEKEEWTRRHFAKVEDGVVYAWNNGRTSWTEKFMTEWNYAKLAESEEEPEEPEEPEVDWNKVEVDTPILVRDYEDATTPWIKRYFAEYKNGVVYARNGGRTSWNEDCMTGWNYAKLAESEEK